MPQSMTMTTPLMSPFDKREFVILSQVVTYCAQIELVTVEEFEASHQPTVNPFVDIASFDCFRLAPLNIEQYHRMRTAGILMEGLPIELLDGLLFWKDRRARSKEGKSWPPQMVALTHEQYHRMIEAGILYEGAPIELIDGLLVWKDRSARGKDPMSIGEHHSVCVGLLTELNPALRPLNCHVRSQSPVVLPSHREPEPDGAIVRGELRDYLQNQPTPADIHCAFEVSDSSLETDRIGKLQRYAAAGIPQYIIVNIPDNQIEVYEQPVPAEGRYAQSSIVRAGQDVSLNVGEGRRLNVSAQDLLP